VALSAAARKHAGLLALVALPMGESAAPHYVLGTDNFYAITRYNWSSQYAMAVIDLAQAIEAAAQTQP
jgi:membrane-bound lytic murein transglycosylase B